MDDGFEDRLVYSASDNSDEEEPIASAQLSMVQPTPDNQPSPNDQLSLEGTTQNATNQTNDSNDSKDSDEDDLNKSIKKTKKTRKLLSSDDEQENGDNDSNSSNQHAKQKQQSIRPSICDSDTKSSSDSSEKETKVMKATKKLIKKKQKPQKNMSSDDQSNSDSDNEDSENDKTHKKRIKKKSSSGQSSSASSSSDSNAQSDQDTESNIVQARDKTVQRMSAKVAEEQMKEIQSESQRLARQYHGSVPYHRPKQHSLKEFLSRRSIVEQKEKLNSKPITKAAAAIKMSPEELIQYMEDLKKRTKEAEEFFQKEESDSEMNENHDDGDDSEDEAYDPNKEKKQTDESKTTETPKEDREDGCTESEMTEIPTENEINGLEILDEPSIDGIATDNVELMPSENLDDLNTVPSKVIELHTERTELDDELDSMPAKSTRIKLSIPTDHIPKLQGDNGFVIDFETNDLKPKPKSGVDELLTRFMKNAMVKPQGPDSQDVSIFHTETGTVEHRKVDLSLDNKPKKEAKPGESMFKLRNELGMKIKENRVKMIAQRLQEEKEQEICRKKMENEDEEFDEMSDDEDNCSEVEQDEEVQEEINDQNDEDQSDQDHNDSGEEEVSDRESLNVDLDNNESEKTRKRILTTLDDDSDDENAQKITLDTIDGAQGTQGTESISFKESSTAMDNNDLLALESEILQLNNTEEDGTSVEQSKAESKLFDKNNDDYDDIGESQLMALCSGSFATQFPQRTGKLLEATQNGTDTEVIDQKVDEVNEVAQGKSALLSSDEEGSNKNVVVERQKKLKKKKNKLVYSDDEEDIGEEIVEYDSDESVADEEDIGEQFVEYDSDENEVEVTLKKSDIRRKASDFVENEAELSESVWGSDDEDEKNMNLYEAELGDADNFDKNKLRDELERIRLREQIDDDARQLRILTERFIEEEDNGQERERKFRWKHLNNGDTNDDQPRDEQDSITMVNSDETTEDRH